MVEINQELLLLVSNGANEPGKTVSDRGTAGSLGLPFRSAAQDSFIQQSEVHAMELLRLGVDCFNQFLQSNWTGPAVADCAITVDTSERQRVNVSLEVDGDAIYTDCLHTELLLASISIFDTLSANTSFVTVGVWRARAYFAWQRVMGDSNDRGQGNCPTLMEVCLNQYCAALGEFGFIPRALMESTQSHLAKPREAVSTTGMVLPAADLLTVDTRAELILEFIVRLTYYGKCQLVPDLLAHVESLVGISINVTGVEGIRRQHQTVAFAQLAARVVHSVNPAGRDVGAPAPTPKALTLLEMDCTTDMLEDVHVSDDVQNGSELTSTLTAIEQCCLIAEALRFFYSGNSRDELNLESVHALAMRIISTSAAAPPSWIAFSMCLLLRSRAEFFRNNTRGRACFQTDALVDQFRDPVPDAAVRLRHLHCSGYPSVWELQRENGLRMMEVGMVVTACEMFKKLKMWPLAMDCLAVAGRKHEALDLLATLEPLSARLLVSKGDMTGEAAYYHEAWEKSNHTSARAQRSLGRVLLKEGDLAGAAVAFELSLAINPLFDEIWFNLGSIYLKLEDQPRAINAFVRCVGFNPEHVQGWVNLSAVYSSKDFGLEYIAEAKNAAGEAVKLSSQAWQFWENYTVICARAHDWQTALRGEQRLTLTLNRPNHPDVSMVKLLVAKAKEASVRVKLVRFLEDVVLKSKQNLEILKILALMYLETERVEESLRTRILQLKETLLLVTNVGEVSATYTAQDLIDELIDCLTEIGTLIDVSGIQNVSGATTGLALTVRSVPRRAAAINGGKDLPRLKDLCDRIENRLKTSNAIPE